MFNGYISVFRSFNDFRADLYGVEEIGIQRFCPYCGNKYYVDMIFCEECGSKLK